MSSLRSRSIFASFAVMAIVAVAFAGISFLGDDSTADSDKTSSFDVVVGDTWSDKQFLPGTTATGSIPGISFTSKIMGGTYFIIASGTFTTAGTYTVTSDGGWTATVKVSETGGSSSGGGSGGSSGGSSSGGSSSGDSKTACNWSGGCRHYDINSV